ncbi:hypothetical protein LW14_27400, partial [Rhizobium sp. H41]
NASYRQICDTPTGGSRRPQSGMATTQCVLSEPGDAWIFCSARAAFWWKPMNVAFGSRNCRRPSGRHRTLSMLSRGVALLQVSTKEALLASRIAALAALSAEDGGQDYLW